MPSGPYQYILYLLQELLLQTTQFQVQAPQRHLSSKDLQHHQLPQGLPRLPPSLLCHLRVLTLNHSLHRHLRVSSYHSLLHQRIISSNSKPISHHHHLNLLQLLHLSRVLHSPVLILIFRDLVWQVCRGPWPVSQVSRMFR